MTRHDIARVLRTCISTPYNPTHRRVNSRLVCLNRLIHLRLYHLTPPVWGTLSSALVAQPPDPATPHTLYYYVSTPPPPPPTPAHASSQNAQRTIRAPVLQCRTPPGYASASAHADGGFRRVYEYVTAHRS
ncbi:hypothetical protein BDW22DRAFT_1093864 [Trametopsis cervina]|nr:hypothetical protein BDW22DRAFT_1093864 [Trametopsis cervina]